jgi:hypothetical protein
MRSNSFVWLAGVLILLATVTALQAQGTAFTYQGRLNDSGSPATGNYDLTFTLYNSTINVAGPLTNSAVAVTNGLFTTQLNFGSGIFTGTNYWLQIGVRSNGVATAFTALSPLQPVTPAPYAIFANTASNLSGTLPSSQLSGAVPSSQISGTYSGPVVFSNSANTFIGTFSGTGSSVSNLNASQLTTGTVADGRLSTNVALLNGNQTFTGANTFTNLYGNSFSGSFFGNGLIGWIVTNGTTFQAQIDHGYLLTNSQLVTVTLPATANPGDIVRISGTGAGGWQTAQNAGQSIFGSFLSYANSYWTSVQTGDNWQSVAMSADGTKLVAAASGNLVIYSGGVASSYPATASSVASSADGSKLFAVVGTATGGSGGILVYTNSTTSWLQPGGSPTGNFQSIACSADGTRVVAVVKGGSIYTSANSGSTWTLQGSSLNWISVASSANGSNLVAAVYGGGIYTNYGTTWTATSAASKNWISVASSADGSKLVAAIYGGGIYTSANAGSTWQLTSAPTANWYAVASSADGVKLAAAVNGGGIYFSGNSGATWTPQTGAPVKYWLSIASSADGTRLAAAVYNPASGLYVSQASTQVASTTGTNGFVAGGPGSAVELQYIGNGKFMPVSSAGTIWAN